MNRIMILLFALFPILGFGQSARYARMFNFSNTIWESAYDIMELPDQDIIVVGNSSKCVGSSCDHAAGMARTDTDGNLKWFTKLGTAGVNMTAMATCMGNDGNLMFLAHYAGNMVLSKLDPSGNPLWHRMVSASGTFWPRSVVGYDNAYFVVGQIYDNVDRIAYICRIEENGSFGWIKFFKIPGSNNEFHCIRVNGDGELVVAGAGINSDRIVGLTFFDPAGNITKTWGFKDTLEQSVPFVQDLVITSNGNYALSFRGRNNNSFCLMEVDKGGNLNWAKRYYHIPAPDEKVNVVENHFGGYLVMATRQFHTNQSSILSMRVDGNGNKVWGKVIDNLYEDRAHRLIQAHNCGYLLVSMSEGMGSAGWMIARADSSGQIGIESGNPAIDQYNLPMTQDSFPVNPYAYSYNESEPTLIRDNPVVLMDSLFHYTATPSCTSPVGSPDPQTEEWTISPNPVHNFVKVTGLSPSHKLLPEYRVYDLQGRVSQSGIMHSDKIDLSRLNAGIYIFEIENQGRILRKRLVKH